MAIPKHLLDELLQHCDEPEDLLKQGGFLQELTGRLVERMLEGEMTAHLGYEPRAGRGADNVRNGHSKKTLKGDTGQVEIKVPRDRKATFEPKIVPKHQRRLPSLDEKILSLYARGMTTREIQGHLEELYHTELSPTLISNVTASVLEELRRWQNRPLEALYPILWLDALHVKVRDEGQVRRKAVYLALGLNLDGEKELLGLWMAQAEGAKFWLQVLTELKNRGVADLLICCVDGLTGFTEAIETVYPQALVQLCIVHMVRASLRFANWKDRRALATAGLWRPPGSGEGPAPDLPRSDRGGRAPGARGRRSEVGPKVPDDQSFVASALGGALGLLPIPGGNPAGDLHDECNRVGQPAAAQGLEDAGRAAE